MTYFADKVVGLLFDEIPLVCIIMSQSYLMQVDLHAFKGNYHDRSRRKVLK